MTNTSTTEKHTDEQNLLTTFTTTEPHRKKINPLPSYEQVPFILDITARGRSTFEGNIYHVHLAIVIMLRAYKMRQLDNEFDFLVATEMPTGRKLNDILHHYSSPRLHTGTLFLQAKHKKNTRSKTERYNELHPHEDSKTRTDTGNLRLLYRYINLVQFVPSINKRTIEETDVDRCESVRCSIELEKPKKTELPIKQLVGLCLFQEKLNQSKFVVVLDGYDEIATYYKSVELKRFAVHAGLYGV
uniref:Uncharacterized protein n=1 Tax=Anopheles minimus TaxID=112268 RepID=A0A182WNQ9_9DIPT